MRSGKSLVELAQEIERQQETKRDVIVNSAKLRLEEDGAHLDVGGKFNVEVNNHAHGQIASRLGIPRAYYDRMRKDAPALLANNVNTWFANQSEDRMVRMLDGKARAVLSDRYRQLDNFDLFKAVYPPLRDRGLVVMSAEVTETKLYLKVVDKSVVRELAKAGAALGDGGHTIISTVYPAATISNSEVGAGTVSILTGVFTSICSNLATFGDRSMKRHHLGRKHELFDGDDVTELFSSETKQITDEALWRQVRDVVGAAFDAAKFESLVNRIEGTQADKIDDPVRVIEQTAKKFDWSELEGKSVLKHLIEGADLSRFGLHNAVTRASQDFDDYDRASTFERQGGEIIELPQSDWKVISDTRTKLAA